MPKICVPLTEARIKRALPKGKQYRLSDGGGLSLMIQPQGNKCWYFRFKDSLGKTRSQSLGQFPELSLKEARQKRDELALKLASGVDVFGEKQKEIQHKKNAGLTFREVGEEFFNVWKVGKDPVSCYMVIDRMRHDVFNFFGDTISIAEITTPMLVEMLRKNAERGVLYSARRNFQKVSQIFRFAIARGYVSRNPASDIRPSDILPSIRVKNFARFEKEKDFGELLLKLENYGKAWGCNQTALAMKLMALTFVRTSTLICAKWEEFDTQEKFWRIPAERMKMNTPFIVPLARQTLELIEEIRASCPSDVYLFPKIRPVRVARAKVSFRATIRRTSPCMSNGTILGALKRMGYCGQMTGHGFRGIASTILHEHGFPHEHIELQLSHEERDRVASAYNHALYLKPRTEMMQWWADYLDELREKAQIKNQIPVAEGHETQMSPVAVNEKQPAVKPIIVRGFDPRARLKAA
jgi:integrase